MKKLILNFLFSTCFVLFAFAQDTTKVKKEEVKDEIKEDKTTEEKL